MEYEVITSAANKDVKLLRSLHERKYRKQTGWFLAEGMRICKEAISLGYAPVRLVYAAGRGDDAMVAELIAACHHNGGRAMEVAPDLLSRISRKDNPQMVIGAFAQKWHRPDGIKAKSDDLWIALDRVRDPRQFGHYYAHRRCCGRKRHYLNRRLHRPYSLEACARLWGLSLMWRWSSMSEAEFISFALQLAERLLAQPCKPLLIIGGRL